MGIHWSVVESSHKGPVMQSFDVWFVDDSLIKLLNKVILPMIWNYIDGLVQDCSISIANTLELLQSCTEPSVWYSYEKI